MEAGSKKYRVIYADPPWHIGGSPGEVRARRSDGGKLPGPPLPYPTMPLADICALPVAELAENDCVLFLWTINRYLQQSYDVARSWGFSPSTMLVWVKKPMGVIGTFRMATEFLMFATRGRINAKRRWHSNWFEAPRTGHSRKPLIAREMIDQCFDGPKIELFAREAFLGWDAWGNEIASDIELSA